MFNPVVFVCSVFSCSLSIYAKTDVPLISEYFGARRSYEEVNPHLLEDILSVNTSILQPKSPQCRQIHLTAIIRHGTRYPTTKSVEKMQEIHQLVLRNTSGNSSWLHEIQTLWSMWYTVDMDGKLVQKGVRDLKHLAVRLSKLFPSLISEEKLRGGLIKFITSSKHRCVNSTLAFKAGLTQLWAIEDEEFEHAVNDTLMRFFDRCARFLQDVDKNPAAVAEVNKFKTGPEMKRVQEKIAHHLGVLQTLITYGHLHNVYDIRQLTDLCRSIHQNQVCFCVLSDSPPQ
ncbi:multiple inositol polyphosphate phosphatase 1-like isoform X1 [Thalassophryne amazonica]|uniref:multiple inositol polyphosphate phosphatase 1-like isoform X1 n=1 Tax=Thalassophryne amazonica TaxID=390379 RepID=UPI0014720C6E|nr:multiple inositol polyphosphate phosphatase 1-like isoform X1 [Thalassophryne amazonica]